MKSYKIILLLLEKPRKFEFVSKLFLSIKIVNCKNNKVKLSKNLSLFSISFSKNYVVVFALFQFICV